MPIYWKQFTEESKNDICRYVLKQFHTSLQDNLAELKTAFKVAQENYKTVKQPSKQTAIQNISSLIKSLEKEKTDNEARIKTLTLKSTPTPSESLESKTNQEEIERLRQRCATLRGSISLFTSQFNKTKKDIHDQNTKVFKYLEKTQQLVFMNERFINECQTLLQTVNLVCYVNINDNPNPIVIDDKGDCLEFAENIFYTYLQAQPARTEEGGNEKDKEAKSQKPPVSLATSAATGVRFALEQPQKPRFDLQQDQQQPAPASAPAAAAATQPKCP